MEFFSTFGGNPMAMTATNAVLDVIDWQKLQQNAFGTGKYLN
jgi:acetylornithine/succinyldiaminopimelate/putrescine aminotransferase